MVVAWIAPTPVPAPTGRLPVASELLVLGANRALAVPSFHYKMTITGGLLDLGGGVRASSVEGDAVEPDRYTLTAIGTINGTPGTLTLLGVGGRHYVKDPNWNVWVQLANPPPIDIFATEIQFTQSMLTARTPQLLADETIDSTLCGHVTSAVPPSAYTATLGTLPDGPPVRGDFWIARSGFTVRRMTLSGKITADAIQPNQVVTLLLTAIGQPVSIREPGT
jgi:hypothetical protein